MAISPHLISLFSSRVNALKAASAKESAQTLRTVQDVVDDHRRRIKELVDHYPAGSKIPAADLATLGERFRAQAEQMAEEIQQITSAAQAASWKSGIGAGQELANSLGISGAFFAPSTDLLTIALGMTANEIKSITAALLPKTNALLSRAALGGLSPLEAMKGIDDLLGRSGASGVSWQAERIVRTEVGRVYSMALDQQVQSLVAFVDNPKDLEKEWVSGPYRHGRRKGHQKMNGQRVPVADSFRNPETGKKIMYPGDPTADPSETICCGCTFKIVPISIGKAMN
jgi:hypothetical protein